MRQPAPDDDATVVRRPAAAPAAPPPRHGRRALLGLGVAVGVGAAVVAVEALCPLCRLSPFRARPVIPPVAPPQAAPRPAPTPAPVPAPFALVTADEATIRDHVPTALTVFRFAPDPHIIVLDFPTLAEQGAMLNRVAALVEKAGAPRDRVLTDAELAAAIHAGGDTPETYYYGHDYPAAALARFFALADAEHVALGAEEQRLRALLGELGWFAPGAAGALISIPRIPQPAAPALDAAARATILHHELSHGLFFTDARYAAYVHDFWNTALTAAERDGVRRFLGGEGYDTSDEELMYNEMQAYVMFTYDRRFFAASNIGITSARRAQLMAAFLAGMAPGWLRDELAQEVVTLHAAKESP